MTKIFSVLIKVTGDFYVDVGKSPHKSDFFGVFIKCEKSTVRADKNTHCDFQKHINIFIEI